MSKKVFKGKLDAKNKRFAIIISRFNEFISNKLLEGALDSLIRHGADEKDIAIHWVPGSFEIPITCQKIAAKKNFDAILCLGAIIRGETPHFDYVAQQVSRGISEVMLKYDLPISFGIITAENLEQAIDRAGVKAGNKGFDAATSAIEMVNLFENLI